MRHYVLAAALLLVLAALAGWTPLQLACNPGDDDDDDDDDGYDFTVISLPDTQIYAQKYPEIFTDQIEWIVENAEAENIVFVTHLGDVINNVDQPYQWANARAAMDLLDEAEIPYGVCVGNHDIQDFGTGKTAQGCSIDPVEPCTGLEFLKYFSPTRWSDKEWFGGHSPTALSSYQIFEYAGMQFIFLHLMVDAGPDEIEWADSVLDSYPDAAVAVSTHRYLFDFRMDRKMGYPFSLLNSRRVDWMISTLIQPLYYNEGQHAENIFQNFIMQHPQIYMVQSGHFDAEYYQISKNIFGYPVHEMLVDFQGLPPNGGNGYLRIMRYDLDKGRIDIRTYSPTLDHTLENGENCDFSMELLKEHFEQNREIIELIANIEEVEAQIEYWTMDEEGMTEFCSILHDGGQRDSQFGFNIDFADYQVN
ncbi:MAG: metallophosphoesterase [Deltaproteobacteria bacterium]|nr:metallophosphoesterase [Deltaproteobacteria bacterium]